MREETLAQLQLQAGADVLDGTLGGGGHAAAFLAVNGPHGRLLGLDRDQEALALARKRLASWDTRVTLVHENFSQAKAVLEGLGWDGVDAVLLDLGFSSMQIDTAARGFSFMRSGPLDMRMDQEEERCAADIVNHASQTELRQIFWEWGEERAAGALSRALVQARQKAPFTTTAALVQTIEQVLKRPSHSAHSARALRSANPIHPATRVFQALRIAVNQELAHLSTFLGEGYRLLRPGGRMVILAYHSLEDRLVKMAFRRWAASCVCPPQLQVCGCDWSPQVRILTSKPLTPSQSEVRANPRARSARLRAVERC
jgi:16S rRNA (cytosine1402-N4)-methyltransferase